jgi:hypothetical protein
MRIFGSFRFHRLAGAARINAARLAGALLLAAIAPPPARAAAKLGGDGGDAPSVATTNAPWQSPGFRRLDFTNGKQVIGQILEVQGERFQFRSLQGEAWLPWTLVRSGEAVPPATLYLAQARELADGGQSDRALALVRMVIETDPDAAIAPELTALIDAREQERLAAVRAARQSIFDQAADALDRNQHAAAIAALSDGLERFSGDTRMLSELVQAQYDLHKKSLEPVETFQTPELAQLEQADPDSPLLKGIASERAVAEAINAADTAAGKKTFAELKVYLYALPRAGTEETARPRSPVDLLSIPGAGANYYGSSRYGSSRYGSGSFESWSNGLGNSVFGLSYGASRYVRPGAGSSLWSGGSNSRYGSSSYRSGSGRSGYTSRSIGIGSTGIRSSGGRSRR